MGFRALTVREQAREVALAGITSGAGSYRVADAVSDVWEPVIRDLLVLAEVIHSDKYADPMDHDCTAANCAVKRAQEALDG